jgi:hypothetical protein
MLGEIHYLNSGDWVESLTAVVEHFDGRFELIDFASFTKLYPFESEAAETAEALEPVPNPAHATP